MLVSLHRPEFIKYLNVDLSSAADGVFYQLPCCEMNQFGLLRLLSGAFVL